VCELGRYLESTCDSEIILHLLAEELSRTKDIVKAVSACMSKFEGAYSVVIQTGEGELIAFRDPLGFRPLCYGRNENYIIFASESVALDMNKIYEINYVKPGELIIVKDGKIEKNQIVEPKSLAHCMFEYVYFSRADSILDGKGVYDVRVELGRNLARTYKIDADVIIPVPDTSRSAVEGISEISGIPVSEGLIKNRYVYRTFIMSNQQSRRDAVASKLNTIKSVIQGKRIILVDDSIVRGTTIKKVVEIIRRAGAKEIHLMITCPPIVSPCFYGIDMSTHKELIAANMSISEIAKEVGVDGLYYQTIENLEKAIGLSGNLCTACLTGKYPTPTAQMISDEMKGRESKGRYYEMDFSKPKVLLIGQGAREHAIAVALKRQPLELFSYMASKNPGITRISKKFEIGSLEDFKKIISFAKENKVDFAIVGPEDPLAKGVVDELKAEGIKCIGPPKQVARLESSKSFTRELLEKYEIPGNPKFKVFSDANNLEEYMNELKDFVVKPDGLTGGKGVKTFGEHLKTIPEAFEYCKEIFAKKEKVIIEEKLEGEEYTFQCFVDGKNVVPMPLVQDHKRAYDGDQGPNTGGMGSYMCENHLLPFISEEDFRKSLEIMKKTVEAVKQETGEEYKGVLYGQFMKTREGPKVVEFNVRFGDPEAMNVLTALKSNFVNICKKIIEGNLTEADVVFEKKANVCNYIVPEGYPVAPKKDEQIFVDENSIQNNGNHLFFASVYEKDGGIFTTASRSIAILALADDVFTAQKACFDSLKFIKGKIFYRTDIGTRELIQKRIDHINSLGQN